MTASLGIPPQEILNGQNGITKGYIAENLVAAEFKSSKMEELYMAGRLKDLLSA